MGISRYCPGLLGDTFLAHLKLWHHPSYPGWQEFRGLLVEGSFTNPWKTPWTVTCAPPQSNSDCTCRLQESSGLLICPGPWGSPCWTHLQDEEGDKGPSRTLFMAVWHPHPTARLGLRTPVTAPHPRQPGASAPQCWPEQVSTPPTLSPCASLSPSLSTLLCSVIPHPLPPSTRAPSSQLSPA